MGTPELSIASACLARGAPRASRFILGRGAAMTTVMSDTQRRPRPEDFGLTEEFVAAAPAASERQLGRWMLAVYAALAVAVFAVLLVASGSLAVALVFTVLAVAAASVLLVPAIAAVVCGVERWERLRLCRRHLRYRALDDYRRAVAEHDRLRRQREAEQARVGEAFWRSLDRAALIEEVARLHRALGYSVEVLPDGRDAGVDLVVRGGRESLAVRCHAGLAAEGRGLGRELEAARRDLGADRVVLVAPAGAAGDLASYLTEHEGSVVDAMALDRLRIATVREADTGALP